MIDDGARRAWCDAFRRRHERDMSHGTHRAHRESAIFIGERDMINQSTHRLTALRRRLERARPHAVKAAFGAGRHFRTAAHDSGDDRVGIGWAELLGCDDLAGILILQPH